MINSMMASLSDSNASRSSTEDPSINSSDAAEKGMGSAAPEQRCIAEEANAKDAVQSTRWKTTVLLIIAINGLAMCIGTYAFLVVQEQAEFESAFEYMTNKIVGATHSRASNLKGSFHTAGDTVSSFARALNADGGLPMVTMPDFNTWGGNLMEQSETEFVAFLPLVADADEKTVWEQYAKTNPWYEAYNVPSQPQDNTVQQRSDGVAPKIFTLVPNGELGWNIPQPQKGQGPYAPAWQVYPLDRHASIVKFDLLSNTVFKGMYQAMLETGKSVISPVMNLDLFLGPGMEETSASLNPRSIYFEPVYDQVDSSSGEPRLSGILLGVLPWENYFEDLLSEDRGSVTGVMENSCGQNFTFTVSGDGVNFLGDGDLHDTKLEDLVVTTKFGEFHYDDVNETAAHSEYACNYLLHIYPTKELQASFMTDKPMVFTAVVLCMFFMSAGAFMVYVIYIKRRQKRLLHVATNTSKIVSSLFPASVRDRILQDAEDRAILMEDQAKDEAFAKGNKKSKGRRRNSSLAFSTRTHSTRTHGTSFLQDHLTTAAGNMQFQSRAPIADVFPSATVFFGDLVGFTRWSSQRSPTQVFHLLETLYGAFDVMANRRNVYKVETIGDCYVAVTGAPEANKDHAMSMIYFAHECMSCMKEVLGSLAETLGAETLELDLRIGLHSGSVLGGVLRGERSRFQLFGDTMNTASRVEHGGAAGRIHISQGTADQLIEAGKRDWLIYREDKMVAKGKGELTTYWLNGARVDEENALV